MTAVSAVARLWAPRPAERRSDRVRTFRMTLPTTATDAELVAHFRRGEDAALTVLVERYSPRLHRYLARWVSEAVLAEDLLQDTWLRVVERLASYDARQPFVVWLFAIGRHRAIDSLRRRLRERRGLGLPAEDFETEEGERLDPLERLPAATPSPLERAADAALARRVDRAFRLLPPHYREALTLRFHEDLALEEIARLLRLPLSTVKTRVQRGLALLRQRAEGLGLEPNE